MTVYTGLAVVCLLFAAWFPYASLVREETHLIRTLDVLALLMLGGGAGEIVWVAANDRSPSSWKKLALFMLLWTIVVAISRVYRAAKEEGAFFFLSWCAFIFLVLPALFEICFILHASGWWRVGQILSLLLCAVVAATASLLAWVEAESRKDPVF